MPNQEDFRRPEKPLEKTREIDNEARISKKAKIQRKFNRNQKRITLGDIQLSSIIFLIKPPMLVQLKVTQNEKKNMLKLYSLSSFIHPVKKRKEKKKHKQTLLTQA